MLHAQYDNTKYVFYVTTSDAQSYTSSTSSTLGYLFKFTNDMTGDVKWGYGQDQYVSCLLYTSPSPRDRTRSRMPSSA